MASILTQSLFATTYKDDYKDSDNYHRILFNSGRALQARELTQMQTIIQSEMSRFARNLFKEGASVNPGGPTLNSKYEFVKLNTSTNALPATPSTLIDAIFTGQTSGLRATVLEVVATAGADPATLYVQYLGGDVGGASTALRFTPGEDIEATISGSNVTLTVQTTNTTLNPAIGTGVKFSIASGDFFTQGHFVFNEAQSIIVSKYSPTYTGVVGFKVTEDVVTATDNSALYDNQGAVPNVSAPGADRYRIRLTLIDQVDVDSADAFVYLAKIVDSVIVENVKGTDEYNKINDLLALRTKEESGNYVVKPFKLKFNTDSASSHLLADISDGNAYINGYRTFKGSPTKIRLAKPSTTIAFNNQAIAANYGNYIVTSNLIGSPNINTLEKLNLRSATTYGGSTIGTARVRSVEEDGSVYKLYLQDIAMTGTNSFESVRSIGLSTAKYADLVLENSVAVIKDAANNDVLFALPYNRPQNLTDVSLQVQKRFTTTNASGTATLGPGLLGAGETWVDMTGWVVTVDSSGQNISSNVTISGAGTTTATISGVPVGNGAALTVIGYIDKSAGTVITKTMAETTVTGTIESDGGGVRFLNLGKADVYDVLRIRETDSSGVDLTNTFRFDNGQRDNYYGVGRLVVKATSSVPAGNIFARFKYFTHGAGDFFAATSYDSATTGLSYGEIPSYRLTNGTLVSLRDVLDFRPRIGDKGLGYDSATSKVNLLPKNTDIVRLDANYYLPRYDKLVLSQTNDLQIIQGTPALTPTYPETPENTLELYKIRLNANTINDSDLSLTPIENKRYTMSDIGRLEKRIDRLEEYTTLSLLELETSTFAVYDSAGIDRTKAGFLADGFSDHYFSFTPSKGGDDYRASIDPSSKLLRPTFVERNIRLIYDSALSTNTILKGDNVYIDYVDSAYISQDVVSALPDGIENINPFAVVVNEGVIELSPSSDEWKEVKYIAPRVIDGGIRLDASQALLFNEWQWQWQGLAAGSGNLTGTTLADTSTTANRGFFFRRQTTTTTVDRVVSDETIREVVGDRVVDVALIPFMRSRKVSFVAKGLIPYQRYWAFFDNTHVSSWVREESFTRFATTTEDYGNRYQNATAHPDGSSVLTSDENGVIEGSFFIPSTPAIKFRTGTRELKFLNISIPNDDGATSLARGLYTANGLLETRQQDIRSTRVITVRGSTTTSRRKRIDPLAQSFVVTTDDGIFATKVAVYFNSKPTGAQNPAPVALEIRPMVNGHPSSDTVVPGSTTVLTPSQVNVVATQTQAGVLATPTYFTFEEPIYLAPNTEYAIVLLTDSTAYNVYVAKTETFYLGSTEKRVDRQPSLGSLFKSQNGTTWEPDQKKDLTFRLFKATFKHTSATAILENADVSVTALGADPFLTTSGSRWINVFHPNHGLDSGDTAVFYGVDSADSASYAGLKGSSFNGARIVAFPDANGYQIYADSDASTSIFMGGSTAEARENLMFDIVNPHIDTLVVENTNVSFEGKFTTGRSLAGNETRFVKDLNYSSIVAKTDNYASKPYVIASPAVEAAAPLSGARSATIKVNLTTTSPNVAPVIDMQRASLILVNNLIDRQDSDRNNTSLSQRLAGSGYNTPQEYVAETNPFDGSHIAKHITVPVTLASNAVGLQIAIAANRPADADFLVYYRTSTEGGNILNQSWTLVDVEAPIPSDENLDIYREYRYLAGGRNGVLTPFTQYQLKIVFRSINSSKVPSIKNLRVIAMAD
jgi:hypothetical protein